MLAGLGRIYEEADRAIAALADGSADAAAVCLGGGSCCKFDLFGHRLYLTVGELALLAMEPPARPGAARLGRCPYQLGGRCAAYPRRALGCRTFFCRGRQRSFLRRLHERLHRRIVSLHQSCCIPYAYGQLPGYLVQLFIDK